MRATQQHTEQAKDPSNIDFEPGYSFLKAGQRPLTACGASTTLELSSYRPHPPLAGSLSPKVPLTHGAATSCSWLGPPPRPLRSSPSREIAVVPDQLSGWHLHALHHFPVAGRGTQACPLHWAPAQGPLTSSQGLYGPCCCFHGLLPIYLTSPFLGL